MDEVERRLAALRERFVARAQADREALRGAWTAADRDGLRHIAHGIAGSAGIFGFPRLSEAARDLEQALDGAELGPEVERKLEAVLAEMPAGEGELPGTTP